MWIVYDFFDRKGVALAIMATSPRGESLLGEHEVRIHDEIRRILGNASKKLVTYGSIDQSCFMDVCQIDVANGPHS